MDPATIAAIIVGLVGFFLKDLLRPLFRGKTKTVFATTPDGTTETITVKMGATDQDVVDTFQRNQALEAEVANALGKMMTQYIRGKTVDFIAQVGEKKTAIEVRNSLERVDFKQLLGYLKAEPGISKLILLSPNEVSANLRKVAAELAARGQGQVEFLSIPKAETNSEEILNLLREHLN